ncbi:MAG: ABC transporter permease, partial [Actinomycetota bacterium]
MILGLALATAALVISRIQRLKIESELVVAVIRAGVQLSIVALVIGTVFDHLGLAGIFVLVMFGAASWTAGRRLAGVRNRFVIGGISVAAGSVTALVVLFGFGGYPLEPQYLIPVGGILIGGCMTATTLAGRRVKEEVSSRLAEIEARLSLGVTAKFAMRSYFPKSILNALLPVLDQTKNTGLITLPGTFVGMILGGASPVEAA